MRENAPPLSLIGASIPRLDARAKVTGRTLFGADLRVPGMLFAKVRRSDQPHARLVAVRTERARRARGVRAVLTARDIPGLNGHGTVVPDHPVLCSDRVRYVGDSIAIVAAESEEAAQKAAELVSVTYEPLPGVFSPLEALRKDAPRVHEQGNLLAHHRVRKGTVSEGFARASVVIESTYTTPFVEHAYLEPEVALAVPDPSGGVTLRGSIQMPFAVRRAVCGALGIPLSAVRVIPAVLGGTFGGKDDSVSELCCHASLLALRTGCPVRLVNTREESFRASYKRHPFIMRYRTGALADGSLVALEAVLHADAGAYASLSQFILWRAAVHAAGPYEIPHVSIDAYAVYTNNVYTGAMRGFGSPQVHFAVESHMDELACALKMDPLELRLKNILRPGSTTATGQVLTDSVGLEETLRKAKEASRWSDRRASGGGRGGGGKRRGVGLACCYHGISLGAEGVDAVAATAHIAPDGSVQVMAGVTDHGGGVSTALAQVAAEELGIDVTRVRVLELDTSAIPDSGPTVASRAATMGGGAVVEACRTLRGALAEVAGKMLRCPTEELLFRGNRITRACGSGPGVSFKEAAAEAFRQGVSLMAEGWHRAPSISWDEERGRGDPYFAYHFGTQIAEVEVDEETGQVLVLRIVAAHDVGKALNPSLVHGQITGGVVMGMGFGVLEDFTVHGGRPEASNFDGYAIPSSLDAPEVIPLIVESPTQHGPFGAKGTGEPTILPTAPAITNAIYHATGRRVRDLPASLERVLLGRALTKHDRR